MAVGFKVGFLWYQIGSGDFLHCFFSTVAVNLENNSWGSRFPLIMNQLYQGSLESENVSKALIELNTIKEELRKISPNKVIWDIDDIKKLRDMNMYGAIIGKALYDKKLDLKEVIDLC